MEQYVSILGAMMLAISIVGIGFAAHGLWQIKQAYRDLADGLDLENVAIPNRDQNQNSSAIRLVYLVYGNVFRSVKDSQESTKQGKKSKT